MRVNLENESALSAERLREVLNYDPPAGVFVWNAELGGTRRLGKIAGTLRPTGYIQIKVDRIQYFAHRLAWLHVYGRWPAMSLDHINGKKSDNRIANLREATHSQNRTNIPPNRDNACGLKGVVWHKRDERWQATITVNKRTRFLGYFDDKESAHAAYRRAALRHFGEFARFE